MKLSEIGEPHPECPDCGGTGYQVLFNLRKACHCVKLQQLKLDFNDNDDSDVIASE